MTLDDPAAIARLDAHRTRDVLAAFPRQCREAVALGLEPPVAAGRPRTVVVAGMGGSAVGGDLLATCAAERLDVPVLVHRSYGLPPLAGRETLVIASSYSGETVETLSAAETALARGCPLVVVTSGGPLGALAKARAVPRVVLPPGLMPRLALGYLFLPLLAVVRSVDLVVTKDRDVDEALRVVDEMGAELSPEQPIERNEAKRVAQAIGHRFPVVYGGPRTASVAYRWKTDLEENAKIFAAAGALPEMNHNEIEAWPSPEARGRQLVLLRDRDELAEVARRFAVLQDLVGHAAGGVVEAWARGTGCLAHVLSLAYLGQWVSYYAAILRGVDPWPVPTLEAMKARLRAEP